MSEITMPKMSDTMEEGTLVRWLKHPGDSVSEGEPVAEIETDKANVEMEAFESGVISKILVNEGESAPVGAPIAVIEAAGSAAVQAPPPEEKPVAPVIEPPAPVKEEVAPPAPAISVEQMPRVEEAAPESPHIKASPLARRIAEETGVDLAKVHGTGPDGRIIESDVEKYRIGAEPQPPVAPSKQPEQPSEPEGSYELSRMRKTIANRMTKSKQTVPHFYVTSEVSMDWASRVRDELNSEENEPKITFTDIIVKACALAIEKFPNVNSFFSEDKLICHNEINIGIAVALEDGLIVPVVHNADKKSLREIARESRELARRARENSLHQSDYSGATFTLTNLGMFDVENFIAIINPPESATLAIGSVREIPVVIDGEFAVSKRMKMTISADHRALDGAVAARFLQEVKRRLESPIGLL